MEHIQSDSKTNSLPYSKYSTFKQAPQPGARFLVRKNIKGLLQITLKDFQEFTNTNLTKFKALQQLKYIVLLAGSSIQQYLETLFRALSRIYGSEVEPSSATVLQIAELTGFAVEGKITIPLLINILQSEEYRQNNKLSINLLIILSRVLIQQKNISAFRNDIFVLIRTYNSLFKDNDEGLLALIQITESTLNIVDFITDKAETSTLFDLILDVQSTKSLKEENRKHARQILALLARKCQYNSIPELHAQEVGPVLNNYISSKSYQKWQKNTKQRFKFDVIVRNCFDSLPTFMNQVLQIIQHCMTLNKDIELRMDMLVLIEYILSISQLKDPIKPYAQQIIKTIIVPALQWKVGMAQSKIRQAGVINIINMISAGITSPQVLLACFNDMLPPLKSCLTDDRAPELRLSSVKLLQSVLLATQPIIPEEELRQLYTSLLERLDDPQDPIRIKVTVVISLFFGCAKLKNVPSIFDYTLKEVLFHFDDQKSEVREAVLLTLKNAAKYDAKKVFDQAKASSKQMKNITECKQLLEYCEQILLE